MYSTKSLCPGVAAILLFLTCLSNSGKAQSNFTKPFVGEEEATDKLFNMDAQDVNYHFTVALAGGNFLMVEWTHLSDWKNGDMKNIVSLAKVYAGQVADSFKSATTAKRIDIHIPIENEPVTMMLCEHKAERNVLLLKGSLQTPLKVNMDTIRILKTLGEKEITVNNEKVKQLAQVQYTFLLKDLDEIKKLDEQGLVEEAGQKFDSVVNKYKKKWRREDRWNHNLVVDYLPSAANPKKRLTIKDQKDEIEKMRFHHTLEVDMALGATFFRNTLCPDYELGASYKWKSIVPAFSFVRVSYNVFYNFVWQNPTDYKEYEVVFVNVELGGLGGDNHRGKNYGASIGFGCSIPTPDKKSYEPGLPQNDPTLPPNIYKMFCSFRPTNKLKLTMEIYDFLPKAGFISLTGLYRIF